MRTRKEKIEFLKGLQNGKRKLNELRPAKHYCFTQDKENPDLFRQVNTDIVMTEEQLDNFMEQHPNSRFITFVAAGTRPRPGAIQLDFNLAS